VLVLLPVPAHAHLVTTGLGPFYDGVSHFFVSPDDLVPVLAMALLAGLNGPRAGRYALFVLSLAWLVGGLLGGRWPGTPAAPIATSLSFLVLGGLVALDRRLPFAVVVALAAALGLRHGFGNGAALASSPGGPQGLVGIAIAIFVVFALVSAFVVSLRAPWTRIAVRVAGSWIAAIGLLLLGWGLRGSS
jgi:hydrogenase/urease accessory protein HupE